YDEETLHAMHQKMDSLLGQFGGKVDAVFYCPHGPENNCKCRKPKDGLFQQIASRYQCGLVDVPAIGDSLRDIQAARKAGATPILVRTGKGERTLASAAAKELEGVAIYKDLAEAVDAILAENNE
ncbi:MAG: HAD-IIIA family hydrolase, partial [Gammaproteobacteria bacterium]